MASEQFPQENPDPQLHAIEAILQTLGGHTQTDPTPGQPQHETQSPQEIVAFNDPSDLRYTPTVKRVMDFLAQEVLGEEEDYDNSEPAPLVYGILENGELVAAAAFTGGDAVDELKLTLFGVAEGRRGQGLGSKLLEQAESHLAARGIREIALRPLESYGVGPDARSFYEKHDYTVHPEDDEYLVKRLPLL
jgi:ribosomal protein S18 acetylase RimI-like enzyme